MDADIKVANRDRPTAGEAGESPAPAKRGTRNLALRVASALGVLAVVYGCLRWDTVNASGWAFAVFLAAMSIPCLREFYRLAGTGGSRPFSLLGYIAGPLWLLSVERDLSGGAGVLPGISVSWCVLILACVAAMLLQLTRKSNDAALDNVSLTVFGLVYCCVLPGLGIHLRHLELAPPGWPMHGIEFVIVCVFVAKVADVGALLVGGRWGRNKLIPRLSPGKTREGAMGGVLFSVLLLQFMTLTAPWMALNGLGRPLLLLLSIVLAAGGMAGDLVESAFKRGSHAKDAGTGVPGFGGILDLVDSLMVAMPAMYFFLILCGAEYV